MNKLICVHRFTSVKLQIPLEAKTMPYIFPTVLCGVFVSNYHTFCSSSYEFYGLQSTFVFMISFGLFTSPERE